MPAITITSLNTGTDEITAVAHGLLTGDRFRLRNVGGALPAATPSLAGATDYFALRTGADTLKICDTNAHALASTGIVDLTGSLGAGTTTVEYGLPYCLPTAIAAPGTQIKSADLNGTWASLVALYSLLVGQAQAIWTSITFAVGLVMGTNQNITLSGTGEVKHGDRTLVIQGCSGVSQANSTDIIFDATNGAILGAAANTMLFHVPLTTGDRVKSVTFARFGNASANITSANLIKTTAAQSLSTIATGSVSAPAASWIDTTITVGSPAALATGEGLHISIFWSAASGKINNLRVLYDRP